MNVQNEINSMCRELQSIINELDEIANGVRGDFIGIGNNRCASSIEDVADKYRNVKRRLQNIDMGTVANHGGGGRSW